MMAHRISTVAAAFWLSLLAAPVGAEPSSFSPDAPCQATKGRAAMYKIDFQVAVTAPAGTRQLRVWLPLATSDDCQSISDRRIETFPRSIEPSIESESVFGNTFAYFEFDRPDGAQLITHRFTARIQQLNWNVDYGEVRRPDRWPTSFDAFQRRDPRSNDSTELNEVLEQIDSSATGEADTDRLLSTVSWKSFCPITAGSATI